MVDQLAPQLTVSGLRFSYRNREVLHDVELPALRAGQITALIGPNAAGKSTLMRCIAGLHRPAAGRIRLTSGSAGPVTPRSDQVFYLPQETPPTSSLTVFETVLLARTQHTRRLGAPARAAERDTGLALARLELDTLATRPLAELSGGQRQLVGLAQAIVRRPAVLLLDEPTANLDLHNQLHILALVRELAAEQPAAVLVTLHDLNLTARFADHAAVLHNGTIHAAGTPAEVLTAQMLREVYRVAAHTHLDQNNLLTITTEHSL